MRRVKNPYTSDLSASIKSSQSIDKKFAPESSSQSVPKSKRKIEIEKLSEDSYQDDEFEDTIISQSHEKTML
jgi:hypothetical protein